LRRELDLDSSRRGRPIVMALGAPRGLLAIQRARGMAFDRGPRFPPPHNVLRIALFVLRTSPRLTTFLFGSDGSGSRADASMASRLSGRWPRWHRQRPPGQLERHVRHFSFLERRGSELSAAWGSDAGSLFLPAGHQEDPTHRNEAKRWLGFPPRETDPCIQTAQVVAIDKQCFLAKNFLPRHHLL